MCTSPIQLEKRRLDGSFETYTVPCGKCPECRAKYQSEYAALSVLEANKCGSLAFLTFTYDNDWLPLWYFRRVGDNQLYCGVVRGSSCYPWQVEDFKKLGCCVMPTDNGDCICPSLNRDDIKSLLKKYRQDYFRRHGDRLDLRFSCFGEYGEKFHRPHYHMIVYGLSLDEVNRLCSKWTFGFHHADLVSRFNADGSDAFIKVSRYVSKYVSKGEFLPDFVQKGYAEKPRKQSSVRFGRRDLDISALKNFI